MDNKPFVCKNEGCTMSFSNEDHLNVHKKKHDMVLNLGLSKSSAIADQTPTPTRFIRNCEEVGLFQDLQNINPFEETFRKAIENSKTGTLHIPDSNNSEDTLHTPQIFHTINNDKPNLNSKFESNDISAGFSMDPIVDPLSPLILKNDNILHMNPVREDKNDCNNISSDQSILSDNLEIDAVQDSNELTMSEENASNRQRKSKKTAFPKEAKVKEKLKESLNIKRKIVHNEPIEILPGVIRTMKPKKTDLKSKIPSVSIQNKRFKTDVNIYENNLSEVDRRRLMNRVCQMRSRERKKIWLNQMEDEIFQLRADNASLRNVNKKLKSENAYLKSVLLKHSDCSLNVDFKKFHEANKNNDATISPTSDKKLKPIQPKLLKSAPVAASNAIVQSSPTIVNVMPVNIKNVQRNDSAILAKVMSNQSGPELTGPKIKNHSGLPLILPKQEQKNNQNNLPLILPKEVAKKSNSDLPLLLPKQEFKTIPIIQAQLQTTTPQLISGISISSSSPSTFIQLKLPQNVIVAPKIVRRKK